MLPRTILRLIHTRFLHFVPRFAVVTLVLFLLLFCGFRAYTVYLTHRAISLLDEMRPLQIGADENSILPLVARYGFVKQLKPPYKPVGNCPDDPTDGICLDLFPKSPEELEYEKAHYPDYTYKADLSPFDAFSALNEPPKGSHLALVYLMSRAPIFLRNLISQRNWRAIAYVSIRGGRIESVSSGLWVEGSNRWLCHSWHLIREIFPRSSPEKTYSAVEGWVELNTTGDSIDQTITPGATAEQLDAARTINTRCLTDLIPCRSLNELSPRAFQYKKLHPESDSNLE